MKTFYSDDKTTQIVLSLLKAHGIRKVIVSPGTTNIALVGSMQYDSFFELYSSVDERSAAYMACGLAYESGEPVVLSCTEATASRNYFPGLTEAYYRKLPILAITGTHGSYEVGHLKPQVINRSIAPLDTVRLSVDLGKCKDENDEWSINTKANMAILELTRKGGGPAHINLAFSCNSYNTKELPVTRVIRRYSMGDDLPNLPEGRIAIFVGSHKLWTKEELMTIDAFCANHNAVILCDKTSGYIGKYRIDYSLVAAQMLYSSSTSRPDLLIHIGEVSGDTYTQSRLKPKVTWRVNTDGDIKDTFRSLNNVFDMPEKSFFTYYANKNIDKKEEYFQVCQNEYDLIASRIPEVAFSNIWILAIVSGTVCHSKQCTLADYYRNIHLYFLKGKSGSELDNFKQQREIFYSLPWKGNFWWKAFLYFYGNYTRQQERMTPNFQLFYALVKEKYGDNIPQELRDEFRAASKPLMKYTNILTFNTRAIALYISLLIGEPWLYFVFEVVVMTSLFVYMRHCHEAICARLYHKYITK